MFFCCRFASLCSLPPFIRLHNSQHAILPALTPHCVLVIPDFLSNFHFFHFVRTSFSNEKKYNNLVVIWKTVENYFQFQKSKKNGIKFFIKYIFGWICFSTKRISNLWQLFVARNCSSSSRLFSRTNLRCPILCLPKRSLQPMGRTSFERLLNKWHQRTRRW